MKKGSNESLQALFQVERSAESARRAGTRRRKATVVAAPHTSVGNQGGQALAASPEFGSAGAPRAATIEVTAKGRKAAQPVVRAARVAVDESQLLDAYWASFGDAATRAIARRGLGNKSVLEVVIGADERTEVGNTGDYPWRCIASLLITAANGTNWIGTGWLVGPRILLTAGHCVYMADQGGWPSQIEVIPGRRGSNRPFESCLATSFRSTTGWTESGDREFDYGAILLPSDCRYGDRLGWLGHQVRTDENLENLLVNLSGYPGDKPAGTQWFMKNSITQVENRVLTYQIDTAGGQSGAPVWVRLEDGTRYGVGIHTNGALTGNSATRITQDVFDNISAWKAEVP